MIPVTFGVKPPRHQEMGHPVAGGRYAIWAPITKKSESSTPTPPPRIPASKRRKATPVTLSPTDELMGLTMQPLNVTIVARCVLAASQPASPPNGSSARKRSNRDTPAASPTPPTGPPVHPYSRHHDLANTRSTIPSPHELARAERMEEEKARQKKENAAAARAAAAIARRRRALRSGGRGTPRVASASVAPAPMIPPIQRAVAAQRARSAEAAAAEAHAAEAASLPIEPEDDGVSLPHRALKRTRSSGLVNGVNGNGAAVGSPLRTVTTNSDDDADNAGPDAESAANGGDGTIEGPARKRSRLAESTLPPRTSRRAASASPVGTANALPEQTSPRKNGTLEPGAAPEATAMRRVVSATDSVGVRRGAMQRIGSVGPDSVRERSRREVNLPARMRDYDR